MCKLFVDNSLNSHGDSSKQGYGEIFIDRTIKVSKDLSAGAVAAIVAKTIIAPVERVKLILQLQTAQVTINSNERYKGMFDCFLRLPKEQGFFSFWRGNMVNIYRATSQESLGFAFKDIFRRFLVNENITEASVLKLTCQNLAAGGAAGVATFAIIYPLDFARTRLAIDMGRKTNREFKGMVDCVKKIFKVDGIQGLYRGLSPSLAYIFLYRGSYYGFFDSGKSLYGKSQGKLNKSYKFENIKLPFIEAFILGQVVTFSAGMISYPLDTIRRRMMMQSGKIDKVYKNSIHCAKDILLNEGFKAFYSGAMVNAIRGVGAALVLAMYNELEKYM
ncbi:ADP/ATP translocase 4 [Strongyloides ratti]|uniref:ADP/ATP translocase n=1 Tax=Strongyloides ratti TaxID=34506 RepID=A0A090KZ61_STRRB|nr:ADP/ATP translocase 4 [Strongyloides ratti]CEF62805.1 ADP/ATP translocase 4 [Strongyloides ratti]